MSVIHKSYKCLRFLSTTVGSRVSFVPRINSTQISRQKYINQHVRIRSLFTTNNFWANVSFNLTDIGEGIREVVVKEWYVKIGDRVAQFDNICEVQSDKASVTITSRYDGTITKLHYAVDGIALVGKPLVDIETEAIDEPKNDVEEKVLNESSTNTATKEALENVSAQDTNPSSYKKTLCIPSVRRIAKENQVDLVSVTGTGKDGRVLKEDILNFLALKKPNTSVTLKEENADNIRVEKITGYKKVMVKTMTDALKIPHFLYCDEIIVTKLNQIRKLIKDDAEESNIKLTILSFFIKAVSNGLHRYPIINSSVDANCENILYKSTHNIGLAMDTPMGLAVPVIKNVEELRLLDIARELNRLLKSGKDGNFHPNDLRGGTFTISNIGTIGGTYTAPVILSPQVAIIAIGAIKVLPRFDASQNVVPEEIVNLSASGDHRVVDGATMARFVTFVKKQIENPYLLLL